MARLGEILLSEKVLTSKELDAALENQVLHGVKLGTCLVEMGYVSDEDLARCLGKKSGQSFLSKDQLLAIGSQNLSVISPEVMKKHRLIPVGINGGALRFATDHEYSQKKQSDIEKSLGHKIEMVAVSGYAIDFFLEKMFGIERPGRFLPKYGRKNTRNDAPAVVEKVSGQAAPVVIDGIEWKTLEGVMQDEKSARACDDIFDPSVNRDVVSLSLSAAAEHLGDAASRDDVAKTVLEFLSNSSGTAALVIIKNGIVYGWKAYSNRKMIQNFEAFSTPIETFPDVHQCVRTKMPYFGNSMTAESKMLMQILNNPGGHLAYFPIFLRQRVIAVLLCDGPEKIDPLDVSALCLKASYALEILILRSKLLSS